jgi:hypothetical protein
MFILDLHRHRRNGSVVRHESSKMARNNKAENSNGNFFRFFYLGKLSAFSSFDNVERRTLYR